MVYQTGSYEGTATIHVVISQPVIHLHEAAGRYLFAQLAVAVSTAGQRTDGHYEHNGGSPRHPQPSLLVARPTLRNDPVAYPVVVAVIVPTLRLSLQMLEQVAPLHA
jgi:hypothetical protein